MPWIPFAVAAALTAVKMKSDSDTQEKTGQIKAAQERYSPWTKLKPDQEVKQANYGQDLIQGAGMGLSGWGAMNASGVDKAVAGNLNAGGNGAAALTTPQAQPLSYGSGNWDLDTANPYAEGAAMGSGGRYMGNANFAGGNGYWSRNPYGN